MLQDNTNQRIVDQYDVLYRLSNNSRISFHCRMCCIFARNVMMNFIVYSALFGGDLILPWRCNDDHYPVEIINIFKWKSSYGRSADEMCAHLDFWYGQIFHNEALLFKHTDNMGIGTFAKAGGFMDYFNNHIYGFIEFVTPDEFYQLHDEDHHWSLFIYIDDYLERQHCILYGTIAYINHNDASTSTFHMLDSAVGAVEGIIMSTLSYEERTYYTGMNEVSVLDVSILHCDRLNARDNIHLDRLLTVPDNIIRTDIRERNNVAVYHDLGDEIFINYGRTYSLFLTNN